MKAFVQCVGCEQRHLDAQRVRAFLVGNGAAMVDEPAIADVVVLVTCAVDTRNENASVEVLRRLGEQKQPAAQLIVGGCLPDISPLRLSVAPVARTFSPRSLERLDALFEPELKTPMAQVGDGNTTGCAPKPWRSKLPAPAREIYDRAKSGFTIRLNHGCLLSCSYCVIRLATGRLESISATVIEAQFQEAIRRAEPTVMLVGGDTGAYGRDLGSSLPELLRALLACGGDQRLFVHDLNANWLVRDLKGYAALFSAECARLQALCIPVQSGSDRVLRQMRRPYKTADVLRALRLIRTLAPHILLGTHLIAGFPGETKKDFEQTLALVREFPFDFATCFRYSEHASATAAKIEPKVEEADKLVRLELLRAVMGPAATILT